MNVSKLQVYSIGVVAANKPLNSNEIEVVPTEVTPFLDGELSDNIQDFKSKGKAADGSSYETSLESTASIRATWIPFGNSNRMTSPDVRRGEIVVIYRFGDVDKFYWQTWKNDIKLRKLETVIYAFSNTQDESQDGQPDNTYFFEVSTHKKLVTFHTSNSDGEPYVYDFQLNTADGSFIFQDDIGNYISVDSKNSRIELQNSEGSRIDMDRKIINIFAPDTINVEAGKVINFKSGESINDETSHITTKADDTVNTVPQTTTSGNVNIQQALIVNMTTTTSGLISLAAAGGSAKGPIDGSVLTSEEVQVTGNGSFGGTLTAGGSVTGATGNFPGGVSAPNV